MPGSGTKFGGMLMKGLKSVEEGVGKQCSNDAPLAAEHFWTACAVSGRPVVVKSLVDQHVQALLLVC